jgi:hypothetical protein
LAVKVLALAARMFIAIGTIFGIPGIGASKISKLTISLMASMYGASELFKSAAGGCK